MRLPLALLAQLAVGGLLAGPVLAQHAAAAGAPFDTRFDYLYVEANEGGSAGGHAAIRFGDDTYHFQYAPTGLLEMARTPTADFLSEYVLLSNRSVHVTRVAVDAETGSAMRRAFDRRYWRERRALARLALLEEARAWLADGAVRMPVTAAGYFEPGSTSLASLRVRTGIDRHHGPDALARRAREARTRAVTAVRSPDPALPEALADAVAALTAVALLGAGNGLAPDVLVSDGHASARLADDERAALARIRDGLEARLVELFASRRPDWGTPFLVGLARLHAIEASLETGRLIFLDAFPRDAPGFRPEGERWSRIGPELLGHAQHRFDAARRRAFATGHYRELDWARFEEAGNHLAELRGGVERGARVRLARGRLLPQRPGPGAALTGLDSASLARELEAAHDRHRRTLEARSGYHVIDRNCVTAIFETIDLALTELAGPEFESDLRAESVRRLGGSVRPDASLAFVPFVSSHQVRERYRVIDSFEIVSDRRARLQQMRRTEPDLWVDVRESNVLSSTIYERSRDDSLFLFFTEDDWALRPVYGAINLAVGIGGSAAGLAWTPFDQGELLLDGLRGVLASLPELFFVNIRKGSNDYVLTGPERDALPGDRAF